MENKGQPQGELPNKVDPALEGRPDVPIVDPEVQPAPMLVEPQVGTAETPKRRPGLVLTLPILLIVLLAAGGLWYWHHTASNKPATTQATKANPADSNPNPNQPKVAGLALDATKSYGNKYADGILPVGDGKYSATSAKQGYIYACSGYAHNIMTQSGGAGRPGPWFTNNNTQYDLSKKVHVLGSVSWTGTFSNTVSGATRTITTNDLPIGHTTGVFPISATDPAYAYDKNPNSITSQNFTYALSANPTYDATPTCEGGQVGVMLTGVALFNGFDAGGRDAGAWEVQDDCSGHPEKSGTYHYHTLSSCIKDVSVHTVIGFALDGFPITGPTVSANNVLTTSDLDECHGIVSQITLDGKSTTMYHYVMTQDFPYSVSCFRGTPINPPGQSNGIPANSQKP